MKLFVLIFLLFAKSECLKILGVFPAPSRSHYALGSSLMRSLAEKGHDVTVISLMGEKSPPKNYRDIALPNILETDSKGLDFFSLDKMNFVTFNFFTNFYGAKLTETVLEAEQVQKLLASDEKFDVVIVEQFINDGLKVFAHHYKVPLVLFVTFGSNSWINSLVANPAPPSYIPEQNIPFSHRNFFDRVRNFIIHNFVLLFRHFVFFPQQNAIMKKHFPEAPDLQDLNVNTSLVLLNSHVSTNKAVPRVPNMVDIGGFHVKPPKKLPKDLQEYLDSATEGVVYFSMGSSLKSVNFPVEKREAFLRVFGRLKEKVLWKWEDDVLPGQPKNVKLGKWLPQQDILAPPNIKVFITHGGLLSFLESVYHGVPLLAIPVFGDQILNAAEMSSNDLGRHIPLGDLNEATLEEGLKEVLTNPKYRKNMKRRSRIMHDRQQSPIDNADYWIQYVVRHRGAPHLRVAGLDLPWYQYLSLDVAAFLLAILTFLGFLAKLVLRRLFGGKKKKEKRN